MKELIKMENVTLHEILMESNLMHSRHIYTLKFEGSLPTILNELPFGKIVKIIIFEEEKPQ